MNVNYFCTLGRTDAVLYLDKEAKRYLALSRSRRFRSPLIASRLFFWSQQFVQLKREIQAMNSQEFRMVRQDIKLWLFGRREAIHQTAVQREVERLSKARKALRHMPRTALAEIYSNVLSQQSA